jgi:Flp pilus assembly protein TadG
MTPRGARVRASRSDRGAALLEAALFVPIIFALFIGMEELGRMTYTYYMIQKTLSGLARYLGTQQGVNFCNAQDPILQAALNNSLTGTSDGSGASLIAGLTPDMVQVTIEQYNPANQALAPCACAANGCDASQGGAAPGYLVVSLTNGYTVQPLFWGFSINPFPLQPSVTVPYGGT